MDAQDARAYSGGGKIAFIYSSARSNRNKKVCRINYLRGFFRAHTTCGPSRKEPTHSQNAGNAIARPLVLRKSMVSGIHLPLGALSARLLPGI